MHKQQFKLQEIAQVDLKEMSMQKQTDLMHRKHWTISYISQKK